MKSKKLTDAARGQDCTFNIVGVCNYDPETTVFCHLPDESNGFGKKSDDISGADGCSACHDVVDGRVQNAEYENHKDWYDFRAFRRTLVRRIYQGVITVKGLK